MLKRKVTYRLYPNENQVKALADMLSIHQRLYNAALEERIRIYREEKRSITFADQCKALTRWRNDFPSLAALNAQSLQVTLKRLDLAFQAFFRRVKAGETPGFPRFKSLQRFSGWGYKCHGDGFRFHEGDDHRHGKLRLSGVGMISIRGKGRTIGHSKTCEILHKAGKWYASITIECVPQRSSGKSGIALDWGVEKFLMTHNTEGQTEPIDNPRYIQSALPTLKKLQQSVARKKNRGSHHRKEAVRKLSNLHAKIANRRKDFHHQLAAKIVNENSLIAVEALSVKAMTVSGRSYKRGLNREILSTAPTQFHRILKSKAEEAGAFYVEIPTREVKPSQTCYRCQHQAKKSLWERIHYCAGCGVTCDRDENAARVILNWALHWVSGQELAEPRSHSSFMTVKRETHAIP